MTTHNLNLNSSTNQDSENANLNLLSENLIFEKEEAKYKKIRQAIKRAQEDIDKAMVANQSMLVYDLHQKNWEDFEYNTKITFETIDHYGYQDQVLEYLQNQKLINKNTKNLTEKAFYKYEEEIIDYLNCETDLLFDMRDYYEAWLCDSWLLNKLEKHNQLIIDYKGYEQWWGRGCTGQKYTMDFVIQNITKELAAEYACVPYYEIEKYLEQIRTPIFNLC